MGIAELMSMIGQLTEYQVSQIRQMAENFLAVKDELNDVKASIRLEESPENTENLQQNVVFPMSKCAFASLLTGMEML